MKGASWALAAMVLACGGRHEEATPSRATDAIAPVARPTREPEPARTVLMDAADPTAPCVFGHHGVIISLGDRGQAAELGTKLEPPPVDWVEREGSTWARVRGKALSIEFFVVPPANAAADGPADAPPFLEARIRGGAARSAAFYLNGHALGSSAIARGEVRVVALRATAAQPSSGANELQVKFGGLPKGGGSDAAAEIDWIHFGVGEPDPRFAAPSKTDSLVSASFAGQPLRAVSLRAPGYERCEGWIPAGSVVEARARLEGSGTADAEIRLVRDRVPPSIIGTVHLDQSDGAVARLRSWPVGDLGAEAGALGAIELSVVRASPGARVVFGQPRLVSSSAAAAPKPPPVGRGAVLVIMSGVGARSLQINGGTLPAPAVTSLASAGSIFDAHRATSGLASGAVGSMFTGMSARDLSLADAAARLPHGVTTIADAARQAGIATAFFTASPLTGSAFGFDRGWSRFEWHSPTEDAAATRVFDSAIAWLSEHRSEPFLLVIHARGGHPPWDVSLERVHNLPPEGYTGGLDPRHAAELLSRSFHAPGSYRFEDADRARAWALFAAAMEAEDEGVAHLIAALRSAGREEDTTFVVTGDVGVNEAARVPFAESDSLDEGALAVPLVIRWAHDASHGAHVTIPSTSSDIASTLLAALGLPAPVSFGGRVLHGGDGDRELAPLPLLATDEDRFALRWGTLVTMGSRGRETRLCDLSLEAACLTDVRPTYPLAFRLLHRALFDDLVSAAPPVPREAAVLDAPAIAALKAWGR